MFSVNRGSARHTAEFHHSDRENGHAWRVWCSAFLFVLPVLSGSAQTVIPTGARLRYGYRTKSRAGMLGRAIWWQPPWSPPCVSPVGNCCHPALLYRVRWASQGRLTSTRTIQFCGLTSDLWQGKENEPIRFQATVASVDNAREAVDNNGVIHGLRPLRRRPTELEDFLLLAAYAHPAVLASLEFGKFIVAEEEKPRITFAPGVELWLALDAPFQIANMPVPRTIRRPSALSVTREVRALVDHLPLRTSTAHGVPSDLINCVFVGSREALAHAFSNAGWVPAEKLDLKTDVATFLAIADHHSYHEGPVSSLVVNGAKPAFVFEKAADTFAKRHHIRIWRQLPDFQGMPVWIGAGTHDINIDFSKETRMFSTL